MPSKHATGQLATSSNAPRSALCANDVLDRCPSHTAARPKMSGPNATRQPQHLAVGSEHLRNIRRYPAHCNRFFTAFVLLRHHPSLAARRRGVVKLWKSSGQSVNGGCIGWATLDVVVGNYCAAAWQAVDKLWISESRWCRRMPPCSDDLRLFRRPPPRYVLQRTKRGHAKRDGRLVSAAAQLYNSRLENTASSQAASGR